MGSAQSNNQSVDPKINNNATTGGTFEDVENDAESAKNVDPSDSTSVKYYDPNRPKGGMPLVNYVCRKKKKSYDKCVSQWYSKAFLTGTGSSLNQEEVCGPKFELYRTCILKGIKKEIWDKQDLPPPKAGSPLAEVSNIVDDQETGEK